MVVNKKRMYGKVSTHLEVGMGFLRKESGLTAQQYPFVGNSVLSFAEPRTTSEKVLS